MRYEEADPSERSRQHGAIDQRHVPDGDSRRRRGRHSQGADPGLAAFLRRPDREGEGVGRHHQDWPHASGGCDADPVRAGDLGLRPADRAVDPSGDAIAVRGHGAAGGGDRGRHGHQHPSEIRGEGGGGAAEGDRRGVRRGQEPFRGQRLPRRPRRMLRLSAFHRGHALFHRQQHPLAGLGAALRVLRNHPPRLAARLVDHARQGQPGDVRIDDASLRPRHRQRPMPGV